VESGYVAPELLTSAFTSYVPTTDTPAYQVNVGSVFHAPVLIQPPDGNWRYR